MNPIWKNWKRINRLLHFSNDGNRLNNPEVCDLFHWADSA